MELIWDSYKEEYIQHAQMQVASLADNQVINRLLGSIVISIKNLWNVVDSVSSSNHSTIICEKEATILSVSNWR